VQQERLAPSRTRLLQPPTCVTPVDTSAGLGSDSSAIIDVIVEIRRVDDSVHVRVCVCVCVCLCGNHAYFSQSSHSYETFPIPTHSHDNIPIFVFPLPLSLVHPIRINGLLIYKAEYVSE